MISEELQREIDNNGYFDVREVPGKGACGLYRYIYTIGLCVDLDMWGFNGRYCFKDLSEARESLKNWNGQDDPPGNWMKFKSRAIEYDNPNYQEHE